MNQDLAVASGEGLKVSEQHSCCMLHCPAEGVNHQLLLSPAEVLCDLLPNFILYEPKVDSKI